MSEDIAIYRQQTTIVQASKLKSMQSIEKRELQ